MRKGYTALMCAVAQLPSFVSIYLFLTQHLLYPEATKLFFSPIPLSIPSPAPQAPYIPVPQKFGVVARDEKFIAI